MITADDFFPALADPTRLRCLLLLASEGELCVCELTHALDVSQPKISRHLATLREAGIVDDRREGLWIHYRIHHDLPAWARGLETLVIALSYSGETEETLSAFDQAVANGCRILAICTGGELAAAALESGAVVWQFDHQVQPHSAPGYAFGLLLAVFFRLGLIPDPNGDLIVSDLCSVLWASSSFLRDAVAQMKMNLFYMVD